MNKGQLQQKLQEVLEKIKTYEKQITDARQVLDIDESSEKAMDERLTFFSQLKEKLNGQWTASIDSLSSVPPLVEDDNVINQRRLAKKIEQYLKDVSKTVDKRMRGFETTSKVIEALPESTRLMLQKQLQYSHLIEQIENDFSSTDMVIKPPFSLDAELMQNVKNLNAHKSSYTNLFESLNSRISGATIEQKAKLYDEAIIMLDLFRSQFKTLADKVNARHELLINTHVDYTTNHKAFKDNVQKAQALLADTAKLSNPEILEARIRITNQLEAIKKIPQIDKNVPVQQRLQTKSALSQQLSEALSGLINQLQDLLNRDNALIVKNINAQKELLYSMQAKLLDKLEKYQGIPHKELDNIIKEGENLLTSEGLSLTEQLKQWEKLNKKYIGVQKSIETKICDKLVSNSQLIIKEMQQKANKLNGEIRAIRVMLSEDERAVLDGLKFEPTLPNFAKIRSNSELLQTHFDDLINQQSELDINISRANEIIAHHGKAKATVGDFNLFVTEVNRLAEHMKNPDAKEASQKALDVLSRHMELSEPDLLKKIDKNILDITPEGRLLLPRFIKDVGAQKKLADKMAFCNLLQANGIEFTEYLKKSKVRTLVLALNKFAGNDKEQLSEWLAKSFDKESGFLHALYILQANNIPLSKEVVEVLADDANKCAVIIQQNSLNSDKTEKTTVLDEKKLNNKEFSALLSYIIAADKKHMSAMNAAGKTDKKFCQPALLVYAGQSKELVGILENNENRENNISILKGVLGNAQGMARVTFNYLSDEPTKKADAVAEINRYFTRVPNKVNPKSDIAEKPLQHTLERLLTVNTNASERAVVNLAKVATVTTAIQKFMEQHDFHLEGKNVNPDDYLKKQEALSFQRKATPILLKAESLKMRKEALTNLAQQEITHRHKEVRLLGDILQMITGAFLLIMPTRLLMGKTAFFSTAKTARQAIMETYISNEKAQQMKEALQKGREESQEEAPEINPERGPAASA